jgi:hypothetical protein
VADERARAGGTPSVRWAGHLFAVCLFTNTTMSTVIVGPGEHLRGVPRDAFAKKNVAYIVVDRSQDWVVLPLREPQPERRAQRRLAQGEVPRDERPSRGVGGRV